MKLFKFIKQNKIVVSIVLVLFFIVTNPSNKNFKDFLPLKKLENERSYVYCQSGVTAKEYNFLIFSIFQVQMWCSKEVNLKSNTRLKYRYLGVAKNFILINEIK